MKQIIYNFLTKLQPEYPKKITVSYERSGDPIPMPMDSGDPIPLEMFKGDPIILMSKDEAEKQDHMEDKDEEEEVKKD